MQNKGMKWAGLLALVCSAGAMAQSSIDTTAMSECRLSYADGIKALNTLQKTNSYDNSDIDADEYISQYAPGTTRPFGFDVLTISLIEYEDDYGAEHNFETVVSNSYTKVRDALLRANGLDKCASETTIEGFRICNFSSQQMAGTTSLMRQVGERSNGAAINCAYSW